jgi:hypothetical protein
MAVDCEPWNDELRKRVRLAMDFKTSLFILAVVFALGFVAGYSVRALISAKHRRQFERNRGYPLVDSR